MKPVKESFISEGRLVGRLMHKHRGRARGVTARQLARDLTGDGGPAMERAVTRLVASLRRKRIPLGGCPSQGYYVIETDEELDDTIRQLRAYASACLLEAAAMRRIARVGGARP